MTNCTGKRFDRAKRFLAGSIAICTMFGNASGIWAQSQVTATPEFNAASIKPNKSDGCSSGCGVRFTPGRVSSFPGGTSTREIIWAAFHLTPYQLSGGPSWLDSDRFDLEAKAETAADESHLRLMLQTLLNSIVLAVS